MFFIGAQPHEWTGFFLPKNIPHHFHVHSKSVGFTDIIVLFLIDYNLTLKMSKEYIEKNLWYFGSLLNILLNFSFLKYYAEILFLKSDKKKLKNKKKHARLSNWDWQGGCSLSELLRIRVMWMQKASKCGKNRRLHHIMFHKAHIQFSILIQTMELIHNKENVQQI